MKTCLIVTGGRIDLPFAGAFLEKEHFDCVVAVDGGLEAAAALGLMPAAVVGDFDTVKKELLEKYRKIPGILWDVHKPEKDETDTELAIHTAAELGCESITILGATGGRMDHALGNLHLLYPCLKQGIKAWIVDEKNRISLLDGSREFRRQELWGKYISFLPLTEQVHGITLKGFKYPLNQKDIEIGTSLCISNELAEETGVLEFRDGVLICVESHD